MRFRVYAVLACAVAVLSVALAACSGSGSPTPSDLNQPRTGTYSGVGLTPPLPRPNFTLTDANNQPFAFGTATAAKPTFLYFGYTHCPDVCPATLADIATAIREVPAAVRSQVQVVFVTTDVQRDTAAVMKAYLAKFDADLPNKFIGLVGTQAQIDAAQAAAHVQLAEDDGQTHSAEVLLYGPDDYARVAYAQSTNEDELIKHDLPIVAGTK